MKSEVEKTPKPLEKSNILISFNLEKNQNKYNFSLYEIDKEKIKFILKEIDNNDNNINNINLFNNIFGIILNFEELKNLNNFFNSFNSFEEAKINLIQLFNKNSVEITEIKNEEIIIKFKLSTNNNNYLIITLNKINLEPKEELEIIKYNLVLKNKEIFELKNKINSLELIVMNLSNKIEALEKLQNQSNDRKNINDNLIIVEDSNIFRFPKELKFLLKNIDTNDNNKIITMKLLYDSEKDGENVDKMKLAYLNKNDIIILIETDKNKRFGGYAHECFKNYEGFIKKDIKAFLFSLDKFRIYKSKQKGNGYSIWNNNGNSIDFGGGVDLRVYHKFLHEKNYTSQTSYDYDYSNETFALNGEKFFSVKYLEIYQVIFN